MPYVKKRCLDNGTWSLHPDTGLEWTDYSECINIEGMKTFIYASLSANAISLILLIPALVIFLGTRQLRTQERIKLHVNLLSSFILTCSFNLLWDTLVHSDRVDNQRKDAFMFKNEVLCKVINISLRYATCTNFFWMFCEGFVLYRLLANAFRNPKDIKLYLAIGWVGPVLPILIYFIIKWQYYNDICWVKNAATYEWIVYTPNLICIVTNLLFLTGILKILLTQLHQHPNEPNNYRRALKATCVLVPLFGLQMLLVIYSPGEPTSHNVYEIVSKIIIDSQGGVIALVFCYSNGEVITYVKERLKNYQSKKLHGTRMDNTQYSVLSQNHGYFDGIRGNRHDAVTATEYSLDLKAIQ